MSLEYGWLVILRIYVALAVLQPYRDLDAGDIQSLKFKWRGGEFFRVCHYLDPTSYLQDRGQSKYTHGQNSCAAHNFKLFTSICITHKMFYLS